EKQARASLACHPVRKIPDGTGLRKRMSRNATRANSRLRTAMAERFSTQIPLAKPAGRDTHMGLPPGFGMPRQFTLLPTLRPRIRNDNGCLVASTSWFQWSLLLGSYHRQLVVDPRQRRMIFRRRSF